MNELILPSHAAVMQLYVMFVIAMPECDNAQATHSVVHQCRRTQQEQTMHALQQ